MDPTNRKRDLRFNPAKLLIDPYARAIAGEVNWDYPIFGYELGDPQADLSLRCARRCGADAEVRGDHASHFDWQNDRPPETPLHDSIIYELNVKGFTAQHPEVPEEIRGTYAGWSAPLDDRVLQEARRHRRGAHARPRLPR